MLRPDVADKTTRGFDERGRGGAYGRIRTRRRSQPRPAPSSSRPTGRERADPRKHLPADAARCIFQAMRPLRRVLGIARRRASAPKSPPRGMPLQRRTVLRRPRTHGRRLRGLNCAGGAASPKQATAEKCESLASPHRRHKGAPVPALSLAPYQRHRQPPGTRHYCATPFSRVARVPSPGQATHPHKGLWVYTKRPKFPRPQYRASVFLATSAAVQKPSVAASSPLAATAML